MTWRREKLPPMKMKMRFVVAADASLLWCLFFSLVFFSFPYLGLGFAIF